MHAGSFLRRRLAHFSAKSFHSTPFQLHRFGGAQIFLPSYPRPSSLTFSNPLRRSLSTFSPSSLEEPRKAVSFWTITFAIALLCGGTWLQDKYHNSVDNPSLPPLPQPDLDNQELSPFLGVIDTLKTMPAEAAPGTVGTLTPEQEAKLQEFWMLLLKVCGVSLEGIEQTGDSSASQKKEQQPQQPTKRRTFGLFGGGKSSEEDDAASVKSANIASIDITDGDDKYGQSKEFQQALVDMKPEEIRTTVWNMVKQDNPDTLLLRFLRARKWDVKKALIMFISTIRWRLQEVNVDDDIMKNGEHLALKQSQSSDPTEKKAGEEFLMQMRLGKSFLHGVDKLGRPICVVRVRLHKASDQSTEVLDRFTVYTIESARMMLAPPVETACVVFDMTNFSLSNMDYNPVKFMIKCFEANYPECLGVVLIHKAPWLFSGIWKIIKGWLDPVVAAKINFTNNVSDLEKFIPRDRIMKELEGDEDWEYKYVEPQPGENKAMEDTTKRDELLVERQKLAQEVQDATIAWISASRKKDDEALKTAKEDRNGLIERLRVQYWQLDPYIRSRSLYDRLNVLQGDGKINFYPAESK
ncbi:CRAL-TRIO domain-containing protein [Aspergillus affinis]|uniref:CRAL-TRIO domain-containing protein n=1 Tax=Aspergillus affinis TaxID=1070780 RepID=UPI0022FED1D9|nr:CRAL/TRIO domain protein [Aspergillus affinis]KAI9038154.1 CRAL/TRIO domain protein [Aspergillus affinis]